MQSIPVLEEHERDDPLGQVQTDEVSQKRKRPRHFSLWEREDQIQAFFAWLPKELHDIPGFNWTKLAPEVMWYCIHTVKESPEAPYLALAAASAWKGHTTHALRDLLGVLNRLFRGLRVICSMEQIADLRQEQMWLTYVARVGQTEGLKKQLQVYTRIVTTYYPRYLQLLDEPDRLRMQAYALPPLPLEFQKKQVPVKSITAAQQARRKAHSDILVPLYPVLRQIVRQRKQVAERTFAAIGEARRKVEAGEVALPFHFTHTDLLPSMNRDARTISEVQVVGREVTMQFILWDKQKWVHHHKERYSPHSQYEAEAGIRSYAPEMNGLFVQYIGKAEDFLWFGDLIEHRLIQRFTHPDNHEERYQARWQLARTLGFSDGCHTSRAGLLSSGDRWFAENGGVGISDDDIVFEPESLYRAILFGSALAMISLSNGSRVSELLQVSWNKERRVTRTETVPVLGEDGLPCLGDDGKPVTKEVKIYLQHLLPKGAKTEEERQLFPLSKECMRLLGEIKHVLEQTHGSIPVVYPSQSSAKYEHLKPEQYLFQWGATPDGKQGIISIYDVQILLRFVLHGLDLYTTQGEPVRVTTHLLRHVMSTHARQYRNVPPETIAHFFLHHRLKELTGREPSWSEISDYYFQQTEAQRIASIRADLDEQEEMDRVLMRVAPTPRDLEQKNADLQATYEIWHTLHPTALGNCGCPGLCPRGTDRSLCLGCSYHVEDPEKLGSALAWRESYAQQATLLEAQGNLIDARQARIKVQQLDDMINVMRMQIQEEAAGRYIPIFKVLPSPYREAKKQDEEKS